jgi:glycosyltransferase involved in cell wall biosynthesis
MTSPHSITTQQARRQTLPLSPPLSKPASRPFEGVSDGPTNEPPFKPRVLIIAERANPEYTSIPLYGWSQSQALSELTDVHVVTQHWNGPAFLRAGFTNFTGINTSVVHEPMKLLIAALRGGQQKGWTLDTALSALEYYYFEQLVWQRFKQRIKAGEFDLVHRITPSSPTSASLIAKKCAKAGVPFVLGPLNGGLPWPKEFDATRRQENEWLSYIRDAYRLMPGYRSTREHAAAIIVGSQATLAQVAQPYREKCVYFSANAVDPSRFQKRRSSSFATESTLKGTSNSATDESASSSATDATDNQATRPIKLIFVGRLVPYKGADMLIDAAADLLKAGKLTLEIIGEGPQREALTAQIEAKALKNSVTLVGSVPHTQMQDRLAAADVFAFPSIREFGGAVVLEAMSVGLVPVVVDYGGPGEMVTPAVGFKVPLGTRDQIVSSFRNVLNELVEHPESIDGMGERSRQRVFSKFTWQVIAQQTLEIYKWVLSDDTPKPHYDYTS